MLPLCHLRSHKYFANLKLKEKIRKETDDHVTIFLRYRPLMAETRKENQKKTDTYSKHMRWSREDMMDIVKLPTATDLRITSQLMVHLNKIQKLIKGAFWTHNLKERT